MMTANYESNPSSLTAVANPRRRCVSFVSAARSGRGNESEEQKITDTSSYQLQISEALQIKRTTMLRNCILLSLIAAVIASVAEDYSELQAEQSVYFRVQAAGMVEMPEKKGLRRVRVKESEFIYSTPETTTSQTFTKQVTPFYKGDFGKLPLSPFVSAENTAGHQKMRKKIKIKKPRYLIRDEHYPDITPFQASLEVPEPTTRLTADENATEAVTESAVIEKPPFTGMQSTPPLNTGNLRDDVMLGRPTNPPYGGKKAEEEIALYVRDDYVHRHAQETDHSDRLYSNPSYSERRRDYKSQGNADDNDSNKLYSPEPSLASPSPDYPSQETHNFAPASYDRRYHHSEGNHGNPTKGETVADTYSGNSNAERKQESKSHEKAYGYIDKSQASEYPHPSFEYVNKPVQPHSPSPTQYENSYVSYNNPERKPDHYQEGEAKKDYKSSKPYSSEQYSTIPPTNTTVLPQSYNPSPGQYDDNYGSYVKKNNGSYDEGEITKVTNYTDYGTLPGESFQFEKNVQALEPKSLYKNVGTSYSPAKSSPDELSSDRKHAHNTYDNGASVPATPYHPGKKGDHEPHIHRRVQTSIPHNSHLNKKGSRYPAAGSSSWRKTKKEQEQPDYGKKEQYAARDKQTSNKIHVGEHPYSNKVEAPDSENVVAPADKKKHQSSGASETDKKTLSLPPGLAHSEPKPYNSNSGEGNPLHSPDYVLKETETHAGQDVQSEKNSYLGKTSTFDSFFSGYDREELTLHEVQRNRNPGSSDPSQDDQGHAQLSPAYYQESTTAKPGHKVASKKRVEKVRQKESQEEWGQTTEEEVHHEKPSVAWGNQNHDLAKTKIPEKTDFQCSDHGKAGIYADTQTGCKVYHICEANGRSHVFECPSGTLFDQRFLVCTWEYTTSCSKAQSYYRRNDEIYAGKEQHVYL